MANGADVGSKKIIYRCKKERKASNKGRNWSEAELELFCKILADPSHHFAVTLENRALKKAANTDIFEALQRRFEESLLQKNFVVENRRSFVTRPYRDLDISVRRLQIKYNNLKKDWKKLRDRVHKDPGKEPKWYKIMDPVLNKPPSRLKRRSSEASETPIVLVLEETAKNGALPPQLDHEVAYADEEVISAPSTNCMKRDYSGDNPSKNRATFESSPIREETVFVHDVISDTRYRCGGTPSKNSREDANGPRIEDGEETFPNSLPQTLGNLTTTISKLVDIENKRLEVQQNIEMKLHEERRELLQFRREEAERNRQHELRLAEMYMRFSTQQRHCCGCRNQATECNNSTSSRNAPSNLSEI